MSKKDKVFYQMVVIFRSYFNPLRYIIGKEKIIFAPSVVEYYTSKTDLKTNEIKIIKEL